MHDGMPYGRIQGLDLGSGHRAYRRGDFQKNFSSDLN